MCAGRGVKVLTDRNNYIYACALYSWGGGRSRSTHAMYTYKMSCIWLRVQYITICARVRLSLGTLGRDPIKIHETPPPMRPIRLASVGEDKKKKIKTNRINYYTVVYGAYIIICNS